MPPEALEAIFVQREDLLRCILERIGKSALTSQKQNTLLVGPRGIGKTHMISLVCYRLRELEELKDHVAIAWLREEEWGVTCFRDLLLRILRALLSQSGDNQAGEQRLSSIYDLDKKAAELAAVSFIKDLVGTRTLVILVENFDELLQKLGGMGEMQLFNFLQKSRSSCMVATSPGPVARVLTAGSPFRRGFFQIHELRELSFEDAIELIKKIGQYQGNTELSSLIATPRGRARVRALRHLAGGNHRAYVIFAPLLAQESIKKLIKPLIRIIDDLTPYYSSRIAALSPEQRKIIEYVCDGRHPVRVEDVAQSCFTNPATALVHLESLCRTGHLQSIQIRGTRYYELREPLMRLSFEVKKHRGKPIGLLLDFLRLWYSPAELKRGLATLKFKGIPGNEDLPALQTLEQGWEDPRITECCLEYNKTVKTGEYARALEAAEELSAIRGSKADLTALASCLIHLGQLDKAVSVYDKLIGLNPDDAAIWQARAWALNRLGRWEGALYSCQKSIELNPNSGRTWSYQAAILVNLNRPDDALNSCEMALKLSDTDWFAWTTRGIALANLERFEDAFGAFSKVVGLEPQNAAARLHLCAALIELNRGEDALEQAKRAIEISSEAPEAWVLMGSALAATGRREESLASFNKALSLGEDSSFIQYKMAELLFGLNRWRDGTACLDTALSQYAHSGNPNAGDTRALIRSLLPTLSSPKILMLSVKVLILTYRKHGMLGPLSQGLVECIPEIVASTAFSDAEARIWADSWQTAAGRFPEFRLPLRLLDSAVRYRQTGDLQIFMDLPQEERKLLESMVGVHIEAIA